MRDHAQQAVTELLVLRAQAGHADALSLLVRAWHERLERHAQRLTGHQEAGRDVLQEAWIDVARGLRSLEDPTRFGAWVYRIVTRRSALWVRQQERRRRHEQGTAAAQSAARSPGSQRDAEQRADTIDEVRNALEQLPPRDQALLELRYLQVFSIQEIALALDIPAGTVKSRLFHARQHLKDQLERTKQ
jgi:RNA polymerase sigma-70 factor (ECF subfamily)